MRTRVSSAIGRIQRKPWCATCVRRRRRVLRRGREFFRPSAVPRGNPAARETYGAGEGFRQCGLRAGWAPASRRCVGRRPSATARPSGLLPPHRGLGSRTCRRSSPSGATAGWAPGSPWTTAARRSPSRAPSIRIGLASRRSGLRHEARPERMAAAAARPAHGVPGGLIGPAADPTGPPRRRPRQPADGRSSRARRQQDRSTGTHTRSPCPQRPRGLQPGPHARTCPQRPAAPPATARPRPPQPAEVTAPTCARHRRPEKARQSQPGPSVPRQPRPRPQPGPAARGPLNGDHRSHARRHIPHRDIR
jgi:hypothetical protein